MRFKHALSETVDFNADVYVSIQFTGSEVLVEWNTFDVRLVVHDVVSYSYNWVQVSSADQVLKFMVHSF